MIAFSLFISTSWLFSPRAIRVGGSFLIQLMKVDFYAGGKKAKKSVGKGLEISAQSVYEFAKYSPPFKSYSKAKFGG